MRSTFSSAVFMLICFAGAFYALAQAWEHSEGLRCIDFYQFWAIGQSMKLTSAGDIYSEAERRRLGELMWQKAAAEAGPSPASQAASPRFQAAQSRRILETYSTPWLYTLFGLAAGGNYEEDLRRYQHFSLLCQAAGVGLLCVALGFSPAVSALAIAFSTDWFTPALSDMLVGNVNRVQLGLLALYLWLHTRRPGRWRELTSGFVLGCAVMFKPNLGFPALTLILGWIAFSRYRKLLLECTGIAGGVLFTIAASALYFHSFRPWLSWVREMPKLMADADLAVARGNFSLVRVVGENTGTDISRLLMPVFLGAVCALLAFGRRRNVPGRNSIDWEENRNLQWDALLLSLGASISLLSVQLAWQHYFVLTIPMILYLLRPTGNLSLRRRTVRTLAFAATVLVALDPLMTIFQWIPAPNKAAVLLSFGTLALFVLGLFDMPAVDSPGRGSRSISH